MPILHGLPFAGHNSNELLTIYHDGLRRNWTLVDRLIGHVLWRSGAAEGWSAMEKALLSPEVRAAGLSMAARRGVHRMLNPPGYPLSGNLLRNKALFARHAARRGLEMPATFDPARGRLEPWLESRVSIIAKPGYSSKGKGVVAYRRSGKGWTDGTAEVGPGDLVRQINECLARHGVVQERVEAHPDLADMSPGVLPTVRVVTCRNESGDPESCVTVLRLGSGGERPVDNFNAGGIAVRLDASGRTVAAFRADGRAVERLERHPQSGAGLIGRDVPGLSEAIALGVRAHRTLVDGYTVVGWDIGLGSAGPTLVEGNWNPGTDIVQLVDDVGLDRTRLGALYRFHLRRIADRAWKQVRPVEW